MLAAIEKCCLAALRLQIPASSVVTHPDVAFVRCYASAAAKKIASKMSSASAKSRRMEVETDPEKLMKYCCGANIYVDGKDPELKPDSEYPDWLWTLSTDPKGVPLEDLDRSDPLFWRRLTRHTLRTNERIRKHVKKVIEIQFPEEKPK